MRWRPSVALAACLAAVVAGLVAVAPKYWSQARTPSALVLPSEVLVAPRVSVADLSGRPAIVHYWASWCVPCRQEAHELARLARQIGDRGRLVGVDVADRRADALAFARRHGWHFPNLAEGADTSSQNSDIVGLPMTLIVDAQGEVATTLYGPQTARRLLARLP
jgi:cytochrome c biogenesis protein CcmG/thiol:disulfide interchange protein DsbE